MQIAMIKYDLAPKSIFIALQDELNEGSKIVINSSRGMFLSEVVKITPNGKIDEEVTFAHLLTSLVFSVPEGQVHSNFLVTTVHFVPASVYFLSEVFVGHYGI